MPLQPIDFRYIFIPLFGRFPQILKGLVEQIIAFNANFPLPNLLLLEPLPIKSLQLRDH
jgi:hypothetical protein